MPQNSEIPRAGGVSRKSCGGHFRDESSHRDSLTQGLEPSLVSHVREFVSCEDGAELMHRVALLKARGWAAHSLSHYDSGLAVVLAQDADWLSGQFVFRQDESLQRLMMAAVACRRLVGAAIAVEFLHGEETSL